MKTTRSTTTRVLAGAGLALLLPLAAACSGGGGGGGGTVTKGDIADSIMKEGNGSVTQKQADCVAEAYTSTGISQKGLQSLMKAAESNKKLEDLRDLGLNEADQKAFGEATKKSVECYGMPASSSLSVPTTAGG